MILDKSFLRNDVFPACHLFFFVQDTKLMGVVRGGITAMVGRGVWRKKRRFLCHPIPVKYKEDD